MSKVFPEKSSEIVVKEREDEKMRDVRMKGRKKKNDKKFERKKKKVVEILLKRDATITILRHS